MNAIAVLTLIAALWALLVISANYRALVDWLLRKYHEPQLRSMKASHAAELAELQARHAELIEETIKRLNGDRAEAMRHLRSDLDKQYKQKLEKATESVQRIVENASFVRFDVPSPGYIAMNVTIDPRLYDQSRYQRGDYEMIADHVSRQVYQEIVTARFIDSARIARDRRWRSQQQEMTFRPCKQETTNQPDRDAE